MTEIQLTVEKAYPTDTGKGIARIAPTSFDEEQSDNVTVITADRLAQESIETAMTALGYNGQVSTITLWDLIDRDDDITLI